MYRCRRCETDLAHCHGTLVHHDDGARECSLPGCAAEPIQHDLVLWCADVWGGCCATTHALAG